MMAIYEITNNEQNMRFELKLEGQVAFLEYRYKKGNLALMHTEVPAVLEGKGLGSALAKYAFQFAKQNNLPVLVYCPFVSSFLKRHPEYEQQVVNS
jgi:predicted GNAT family acetyltransferase